MPSEYDRKTIISKFERLKNKLQQVTPAEFVVKAPPLGPRGAPAFSEFEYDLDPFSVSVWLWLWIAQRGAGAQGHGGQEVVRGRHGLQEKTAMD